MDEAGTVTRAVLARAAGGADDRALARELCRACVEVLDVDGASLSLMPASASRVTLWASNPTAALVEELQFSLNEGVSIQAATTGFPVAVPDIARARDATRWPVFASTLAEHAPVEALFALPLQWGARNIGVLDLHRREPGDLDLSQWNEALAAATLTTPLLLDRYTNPGLPEQTTNPEQDDPLARARAQTHLATGMVVAQLGLSSSKALARLRAYAFAHQRLLSDVARDVIERTLMFTHHMD
jgi:GAF domain-containing protein